jgi:uncharacterized protein (TIGR02611 family)
VSAPERGNGNALRRAVVAFRGRVLGLPGGRIVWRVAVAVIGLVLVVAGVILLPLPGPGWLIIFLGIGVWATEFAWASRLLRRARMFVSRWTAWVSGLARWKQALLGAAGFAAIGVLVVLGWLWWRRG